MQRVTNGGIILPDGSLDLKGVKNRDIDTEFVDRIVAILTNEARLHEHIQPFALISALGIVAGMQQFKYTLKDDDILGIIKQGMESGRSAIAKLAATHIQQTKGVGTPT